MEKEVETLLGFREKMDEIKERKNKCQCGKREKGKVNQIKLLRTDTTLILAEKAEKENGTSQQEEIFYSTVSRLQTEGSLLSRSRGVVNHKTMAATSFSIW